MKTIEVALMSVVFSLALMPWAAAADGCDGGSSAIGNGYVSSIHCTSDPSATSHDESSGSNNLPYTAYRWVPSCHIAVGKAAVCYPRCPVPGDMPYRLLGLYRGEWYQLGFKCVPLGTTPTDTVTPATVARAFQRIPLPALRAITQPADKTLVNFDTIFYVDATPMHRTLTLLGQRVELEITPSTFRWVHGDGTTAVTQIAGSPYPAKDIVYRYQQAHVTVSLHVEIVWTARWSLNGGPYQDVDGTVTTVGPDTPLRIAEATPALSGYGH